MLQIAIDLGTYVLVALGGAGVLFLLASAGVVEIPRRAKKAKEPIGPQPPIHPNCRCEVLIQDDHGHAELLSIVNEGPEPRHVREIVLPLPTRAELRKTNLARLLK